MEMVVVAPPAIGKIEDLRRRFFATPLQALLSLASLAVMVFLAWKLLNWAVFSAVFTTSGGPEACQAAAGACWSVIAARWRIILFGLYPYDEQWRSALACLIVVVMTVLSCVPAFWTGRRIALVWGAGTALFYVLMKGGVLGLPYVGEEAWGGLALTLFIFVTTCLIGFPLAICLALLRRSGLPWISRTTGLIIDGVRSLPLISILFTFAIVLPFALPQWLVGDKLYRVILGSAL
ncbi:MAG: amino acid ABC transporter permease, partial [Mesorhizobium sp.]